MMEQIWEYLKYTTRILKQFTKQVRFDILGYYTSYMYKSSFESCHFHKNYEWKWPTWWRHIGVMTSSEEL